MANAPMFSDAAVKAGVDAAVALLNVGGAGSLAIYTGAQPTDANTALTGTLLATLPLSATAAPASVAAGVAGSRVVTATFSAITSGTAGNTGTAGYFALLNHAGTVVAYGSVGTSAADLNLNSLAISSGATVSCSAFTITQPEQ